MNKRISRVILLVVFAAVLTTYAVMAGTYRSPSKDIWCLATAGSDCYNEAGLSVVSSSQVGCAPSRIALIGWDLTDVSETIGTAELTLTTFVVSLAPAPPATLEFTLFEPSTQNWVEDVSVQSSPGSAGATLATAAVALSDGNIPQTVVFGGSANPTDAATLGAYFNNLKASGSATVGVRISGGCLQNTGVFFNDRENSGNLPGGAAATEPDLILFTPTAVSLSTLNATDQGAGGGVTAVVVVGLLGLVVVGVLIGWPRLRRKQCAE